jgi:hypothetical protein
MLAPVADVSEPDPRVDEVDDIDGVDLGAASDVEVLPNALALAAVAVIVAAVLVVGAAFASALGVAEATPGYSDSIFRSRIIRVAEGAAPLTAFLLLVAVLLVALFDYVAEDDDATRLPPQWRSGVLWGVAMLGGLVVIVNMVDIVNFETGSVGAGFWVHVWRALGDLAAAVLAFVAMWLAWDALIIPDAEPEVAVSTGDDTPPRVSTPPTEAV